jgi:hypothetical protein
MYTEKRHYMFINIYKKNPIDVDKCVQIEHTFWIDKHVHVQTNMYTTDICDIEWCTCLSIQNVCSICTHLSTSIGFFL